MQEVVIRDIGPITEFRVPLPEGGGVVEFIGPNGSGKSRGLQAVNALVTGNTAGIEHRDGVVAGEVQGFNATLKVARRATRAAAEIEVTSLEGRFSVLDLVDPKIKSPEAADAKRIKALVQLTGTTGADPSLFYPLLGGQQAFLELVKTKTLATDDLVTLASRIKRDLEDEARNVEEEAQKASIAADSDRQASLGVDMNAADDAGKLAEDLELAISEEATLKQQARSALEAQYRAEQAGQALQTAEANYKGIGVGLAQANTQIAAQGVSDAQARVDELQRQLAQANTALFEAQTKHEKALTEQQSAETHEATMARWREQLANELPPTVSDEQLAAAADDVRVAREAMLLGQTVRDAKARVAQADVHAQRAAQLRTHADRLRKAAQGTDSVLSDVVGKLGCPLSVSHGRLVTPTDRSDTELFSDLSRGEQWMLALSIAIDAVGQGGALVIDQEGWEGIDPEHQALIANRMKGSGAWLFTAHCDVGELRVRTNGNGSTPA
jgi:energy-coupling factor transporter ATP-binding protein EcfA2